jgi:serine/threonine-protein kinase
MSNPYDPFVAHAASRVGGSLRGKWTLDRLLGVGGTAAVYAATHRNGKLAAVKILHPSLAVDATVRARFLREGYAANKVGHPGAVSVLDDDTTEDGAVFLVMELLLGETIEARAARSGGRLEPAEVLSIADQLLSVLVAAHEQGVIHRDVKPENVFLTLDGSIKVLDFGIARLGEGTSNSVSTYTDSLMGTPAYMAPEQAAALWHEVDGRTDLWAVGAVMFKLL